MSIDVVLEVPLPTNASLNDSEPRTGMDSWKTFNTPVGEDEADDVVAAEVSWAFTSRASTCGKEAMLPTMVARKLKKLMPQKNVVKIMKNNPKRLADLV